MGLGVLNCEVEVLIAHPEVSHPYVLYYDVAYYDVASSFDNSSYSYLDTSKTYSNGATGP